MSFMTVMSAVDDLKICSEQKVLQVNPNQLNSVSMKIPSCRNHRNEVVVGPPSGAYPQADACSSFASDTSEDDALPQAVACFDMALERDLAISRFNAFRNAGRVRCSHVEEPAISADSNDRTASCDGDGTDGDGTSSAGTSPDSDTMSSADTEVTNDDDPECDMRSRHRALRVEAAAHRRALIADLCKCKDSSGKHHHHQTKAKRRALTSRLFLAEPTYFREVVQTRCSPMAHSPWFPGSPAKSSGSVHRRVRWLDPLVNSESSESSPPCAYQQVVIKSCVRRPHSPLDGSRAAPFTPAPSSVEAIRRRYLSRLGIAPTEPMVETLRSAMYATEVTEEDLSPSNAGVTSLDSKQQEAQKHEAASQRAQQDAVQQNREIVSMALFQGGW
eukprot:CAMPEP_0181288880 /NCGR_PEP_ID=MMETSP1101-20121128/579_1 /TAXON_ID=46948 /ORGANISM="Rhodomonas abbreviata, Strain Caron Lab Isolate" /LENGTH=387 /DNA_ID=CAMNT_0023393053 /DNA_START=119 /DNA_END=1279 /DNA_ORIENTATION=-